MTGFVDMHCHIVPYVDDGANDMDEAIKMLKMEYAEGVRTIIATPHFRKKMFETPREVWQPSSFFMVLSASRVTVAACVSALMVIASVSNIISFLFILSSALCTFLLRL